MAQTVKNLPARRPRFNPWVRNIPWRREWQPTPVFLEKGFKGLDLIDRVPEEIWIEVRDIVQEGVIKTIPKGKKNEKGKMVV